MRDHRPGQRTAEAVAARRGHDVEALELEQARLERAQRDAAAGLARAAREQQRALRRAVLELQVAQFAGEVLEAQVDAEAAAVLVDQPARERPVIGAAGFGELPALAQSRAARARRQGGRVASARQRSSLAARGSAACAGLVDGSSSVGSARAAGPSAGSTWRR